MLTRQALAAAASASHCTAISAVINSRTVTLTMGSALLLAVAGCSLHHDSHYPGLFLWSWGWPAPGCSWLLLACCWPAGLLHDLIPCPVPGNIVGDSASQPLHHHYLTTFSLEVELLEEFVGLLEQSFPPSTHTWRELPSSSQYPYLAGASFQVDSPLIGSVQWSSALYLWLQ